MRAGALVPWPTRRHFSALGPWPKCCDETKSTMEELHFKSWLSGFTDGEGCFCVSFTKLERLTLGIETRPSFSIAQHKTSVKTLELIQDHLQCGGIRFSKRDQTYKYEVRNLSDLNKHILPHFTRYPLLTQKATDFAAFARVCNMMKMNLHLSPKGLEEIILISTKMNPSGSRKYSSQYLLSLLKKKTS